MTDQPIKRPSLREAARRGVEAKRQAQADQNVPPAEAPVPAPAPRPAPFQKVKPPVVGVEQVTVKCGHVVPFELFDLQKDKFRKDRRKKLTDRDCSACRIQAQEAKQAAEMAAARQRRQERGQQPAGRAQYASSRLPHGSRFDVAYDAAAERWTGTLTVPVEGHEPQVFTGAESGVFRLLRELDRAYREATARPTEGANTGTGA